jgi:hypothetical protein
MTVENEAIIIDNMDEPFFLLGDYSVTTQHLVEVEDDKYANFTDVELSSVYATADRKYIIHCTQYRCVEGEDGEVPFDDNFEVINCLHHYELNEIFEQYDFCTIIVSQVYGTTADLTIIPNEVLIETNDLFNFVNHKPSENSYKYLIYDKNKDAFVRYDGNYRD